MKVYIGLQIVKTGRPTWAGLKLLVGVCALQVDGIREYWSFCGEIEDLDVMRFPDTGRFKGIAFITYATVSSRTSALTHGWCLHSALHPEPLSQLHLLRAGVICPLFAGEQHASVRVFCVYVQQ